MLEQEKKEIKKAAVELPGRVLTSEMGISNDGTVEGGVSGKYQGLGRTDDVYGYDSFRRAQGRR